MLRTRDAWRDRLLTAVGLAGLALSGCATTWDDITSRDFKVKDLWTKTDPLVVLRDSNDGDKRARAIRELHEPKLHGGTAADQDFVMELLSKAATSESHYYTRLEAVRKLGEFKDPRAAKALEEAYYKADSLLGPNAGADRQDHQNVSTLRVEALNGLGRNGDPAGAELLVRVLKQPRPDHPAIEVAMVTDECIAAARALAHFPQYQSTEALALVLKNDKDPALRRSAHESLMACTGKKLPADYAAWDEVLHQQGAPGKDDGPGKKKGFLDFILTGGSNP